MSVTVRVVDGLALQGKQTSAASTGGILVIIIDEGGRCGMHVLVLQRFS